MSHFFSERIALPIRYCTFQFIFLNEQAVRDENIVTANGTGQLEFCKEILYALEADTADAIEESYLFYKTDSVREHKMNEKITILKKEYLSNQEERQ